MARTSTVIADTIHRHLRSVIYIFYPQIEGRGLQFRRDKPVKLQMFARLIEQILKLHRMSDYAHINHALFHSIYVEQFVYFVIVERSDLTASQTHCNSS